MYVNENLYYPNDIKVKIENMLFDYDDLDDMINERRNEIIMNINNSLSSYERGINGNERDICWAVCKIMEDKKINEWKVWKKIINTYISKLYDLENKTYYFLIKYFYKCAFDKEKVMELMNIDIDEFYSIKIKIISDLYRIGLEKGIFNEEVKINVSL